MSDTTNLNENTENPVTQENENTTAEIEKDASVEAEKEMEEKTSETTEETLDTAQAQENSDTTQAEEKTAEPLWTDDSFKEPGEADEKRTKKGWTKKRKIITAVGAVVVILGGIYAGGSYYFSNHFFPNTTINGVDTSMQQSAEALQTVKDHLASYQLSIHSEDGDMTIDASEAGLEYTDTENVQELMENQNNYSWITEVFHDHVYTAMKTTVDDDLLTETVENLSCMNPEEVRKSKSATIVYDEDQKQYVIKEATVGNVVEEDKLLPAVKEAILAGDDTLDMTTNEYYKQPKYTSTSEKVVEAKEKIDKYMSAKITLKDGERSYTIDNEDIHNFIKIGKGYKVSIQESKVKAFVQDTIWDALNTTDNATIVNSPGSGVFYVADSEDAKVVRVRTESEQIVKDIKAGKTTSRKPEYMTEFLISDYANIVGDTYVEVSISDQHVWAVEDGEVVLSTDVVTGNVSTGHASPTGIYTIKWKTTNYTMRKYSSFVNYWMPYDTNEGIGFHDATWRSSFGGSIYYYSGSHGCINMPYSAAKQLYSIVDKGWVVIVH